MWNWAPVKSGSEGPASSETPRRWRWRRRDAGLPQWSQKKTQLPLLSLPSPPAATSPSPAHNAIQSIRENMRHPQSHFPSCFRSSLSPYLILGQLLLQGSAQRSPEDASSLPNKTGSFPACGERTSHHSGRPSATPTPIPSSIPSLCSSLNL